MKKWLIVFGITLLLLIPMAMTPYFDIMLFVFLGELVWLMIILIQKIMNRFEKKVRRGWAERLEGIADEREKIRREKER